MFVLSGVPLGFFSAPLKQIVGNFNDDSYPYDNVKKWTTIELSSANSMVKFLFSLKHLFGMANHKVFPAQGWKSIKHLLSRLICQLC